MRGAAALLLAFALLGAAPSPAASPRARTITVVCRAAHLYAFLPGSDRPNRVPEHDVAMGARFALVSGPRTTLLGFDFYETNIPVVEPGLRGHYWLSGDCAAIA